MSRHYFCSQIPCRGKSSCKFFIDNLKKNQSPQIFLYIFDASNCTTMRTLSHFLICCTILCVASCSVNSITDQPSNEKESSSDLSSFSPKCTNTNFSVNPVLLNCYLKNFYKGKKVESIEPLIEQEDTLAYYVQFSDDSGWALVSADMRISPVLASANDGAVDFGSLDLENPALFTLFNYLEYIKEVKAGSSTELNSVWAFLSPKQSLRAVRTKSQNGSRGYGQGMWIPVDTSYRQVVNASPKLTLSSWGQDSLWKQYTPKINNQHTKVGCAAVAVGQLLYAYYRNDPGQYTIPSSADNLSSPISFSHFTTSAWSSLVPNLNFVPTDTTAIFLSWLGKEMHSTYGLGGTDTDWSDQVSKLNEYFNYRVGFHVGDNNQNQRNMFCDTVVASIFSGSPVYFVSKDHHGQFLGHSFLIDQCTLFEYQCVITYEFDPDYNITEDDIYNYPYWCFVEPANGIYELEYIITLQKTITVKMNWGWNGSYNNTSNLLRARSYDIGENGSYLSTEQINLTWIFPDGTITDVYHWGHHFTRNIN